MARAYDRRIALPRRRAAPKPGTQPGPLAKLERELHHGWLVQRGLATWKDVRAAAKQGRDPREVARERKDAERAEQRGARVAETDARELLAAYIR